MKRRPLPAGSVDNAHDDLASSLVYDPFLDVGLRHLAVRAPILSSGRIGDTRDDHDDILLL